ncbi:DNA-binding protein [Verrucosispora sp. WMMD1129]|uniref:helix-turn-helix transcriptional regulator n=1 Tax=Verrucosispora sp. WMMD1129 TaxID=3016093 RepID=UPI00249CD103|nr:DNA-binding protein [Verrucosispora sp. WMMD1129]WFE44149.1 DNA-binding protein [Verrucosispora sp. WMMD1129]
MPARPKHLYGRGEIARRLQVSRQRAGDIIARPDFPAPYDVLGMGAVWRIADVERWIAEHRPHLNAPDSE